MDGLCYSSSCVVVFNASGVQERTGWLSDLGGMDKADKADFPLCALSVWTHIHCNIFTPDHHSIFHLAHRLVAARAPAHFGNPCTILYQKFLGRTLSRLRWRTAVRSRPRWGRQACRWASFGWFLTVCAEILWLCKSTVTAAGWVSGLRRSWRGTCWMWRPWDGVVTCSLWLLGQLDVLPNPLKCLLRWLMVEKWTLNSWATALVGIPALSMPNAHSLKICDICGIVLCDKTEHFRMAFNCGQPKAHPCKWSAH